MKSKLRSYTTIKSSTHPLIKDQHDCQRKSASLSTPMRSPFLFCLGLVMAGVLPSGCHTAPKSEPTDQQVTTLKAEIRGPQIGLGEITLTLKGSSEIEIQGELTGLSKGLHGFHIHENGNCASADFSTAGGHFNPEQSQHGDITGSPRHFGDLGNIEANSNGKTEIQKSLLLTKTGVSLQALQGKALVIHEGIDDLKSQPAGNSGKRIACGVIQ